MKQTLNNDQMPESFLSSVTSRLFSELNNKLENYIIEGLRLKGFEFENKIELENFIKERCSCVDNIQFKERIYSIDEKPFFLHKYEIIYEPITEDNNGIKMSANYGSYAYL